MNNSVSTYCNMHTMHTLASIHSTTTRVAISMHTTSSYSSCRSSYAYVIVTLVIFESTMFDKIKKW